ncbi:MAG: penicillin acylase family protein [Halobacteriales archaeon]|nr:penicillin acylase family protein [Halobacteriales archaeon]
MDIDRLRRGVVTALFAGGLGATQLPAVRGLPEQFAPLSGETWAAGRRSVPDTVESPYGEATVTYDDNGVPTVEAAEDAAASFAVGYVQAADRLFQLDLLRRLVDGSLASVVGERAVESDVFNTQMDFRGAAAAGWANLEGTDDGVLLEAYADGVNRYIDIGPTPPEFGLLGYEPERWAPPDTLLIEKLISWGLTGSFAALREAVARRELGDELAEALYPDRYDHDVPILRDGSDAGSSGDRRPPAGAPPEIGGDLVGWLGQFESPEGIGSNSWVVAGDHTASGAPLLATDPHLQLSVPPVWYEQQLRTDTMDVHGVAFPGVPTPVIGTNAAGAWGFTNAGTDTIGFYRYEIDGERYRYDGAWREFETETRTVEVADGDDREVTIRKTVHGPLIERAGERVGVAWVGHTATETMSSVLALNRADDLDEVLAALRQWDAPAQNFVWADRDGRTLYYLVGRHPIRRVDGERVPGDRVFDGSAGEGEWDGFEPFGASSWEGFVGFEDKPHAIDADYVGTANQRIVDDDAPYLRGPYASPYRARRLYGLLDERAAADRPMDVPFMKRLQRDVRDGRADDLVPALVEAADGRSDLAGAAAALEEWDHEMRPDSRGALLFERWFDHYADAVYDPVFENAGLDGSFQPSAWVTATLDPDGPVFDGRDRSTVMADALEAALEEVEAEGWETYGDYSHTGSLTHPFELGFLNYPSIPAPGSAFTLRNFDASRPTGSSWRMVVDLADGSAEGVIPGGNDGVYFGEHYDDRLRTWVDGGYTPLGRNPDGDPDLTFEGESS